MRAATRTWEASTTWKWNTEDPSKRGKFIVILGVVLALAAGGAAFFLINQAQQQAGQSGLKKVSVVVAARAIPGPQAGRGRRPGRPRDPPRPDELQGIIVKQPDEVIGRVLAVTVFQDQMITTEHARLDGDRRPVLHPRTGRDRRPGFRGLARRLADRARRPRRRRAAPARHDGRRLHERHGQRAPGSPRRRASYYTDKSTKITYQNMIILARAGTFYVVKATLAVAEEISHLQASGNATFSFAMRPEADIRLVDASDARRDDEHADLQVRTADPGELPAEPGPDPDAAADADAVADALARPRRLRLARSKHRPLIR